MPCFHPLRAWTRAGDGPKKIITFKHPGYCDPDPIQLPCGQCCGCRIDRSKQWAVRCIHEAQMSQGGNSFITLTYADNSEPSLNHGDFQKFMKRLRKNTGLKIRYYMCGEYGLNQDDVKAKMKKPGLGRKHFHAIIFGTDFPDRKYLKTTKSGEHIYRSATLEKSWKLGHSSTADVTYQSAAYVARYILKKQNGEQAHEHYTIADPYTGECIPVRPEYTNMSRKPGIGKAWFDKYKSDVFPEDHVIVQTKKGPKKVRTPAYYTSILEKIDPDMHTAIKSKRLEKAYEHYENNTPERLAVREQIQKRKINQLKRTL